MRAQEKRKFEAVGEGEDSTAEYLARAYLELRIQPNMERIIECWSADEKTAGEGRRDAFDVFYMAANDPLEEFLEHLENLFSVKPSAKNFFTKDESESGVTEERMAEITKKITEAEKNLAQTKQDLQIFSRCAAGEDPEILRQYCRLSSGGEEKSKTEIKNFFQSEMNKFLRDNFSDLWEARCKEVRVIVANDYVGGGGGGSGGGSAATVLCHPAARRLDDHTRKIGGK
jgi:hypothetical protein